MTGQHLCKIFPKIASFRLQVIGNERTPTMSDRGKMVYTEATLLEVQRIVTIGESTCNREWNYPQLHTEYNQQIKANQRNKTTR